MGNELCQASTHQHQYTRAHFTLQQSPSHQGDQTNQSIRRTQTIIKPFSSQQFTQLIFKNNFIKCKTTDLKYLRSQQSNDKTPLINGTAKVYSKLNPKQLIFQGQLKNSLFNGYGKLYQNNQLIYQGQFKNNLFDGWGITNQYVGQFRDGKYDGYGIYQEFQNTDRKIVTFYYQGYFQNGRYSGNGVLIKDVKWSVQEIQRIHNQQGISDYLYVQIQHGMDIINKYGAKQLYIGQFSNGFRHGFGRLFRQKMEFSGQFSHNLYHGLGTIYNNTDKGKRVIQSVFKMGKQFKH